jgi:hypothetical protein
MSEQWQDPWDSPQLWAEEQERERWYTREELNDRMEELRVQRAARMASRYYCPVCGEVGYGYKSHLKGWVVDNHTRCLPAEGRHEYYYQRCPGGKIDPAKDKAP